MKTLLSFFFLLAISNLLVAQNTPVAVNDTVTTMSEHPIDVSVLQNDYDPDGDEIEIQTVRSPEHGESDYDESTIYYTSDTYVGLDSLKYRIREVEDHSNVSEYAWVFFNVEENPNLPIAVDDNEEVLKLIPTQLNILENDFDPNGGEFIIDEVHKVNGSEYANFLIEISEDSLSVIVTTQYPLEDDLAMFEYRIKEKNTGNAYYSDWATVTIDLLDNPDIPIAADDNEEVLQLVPTELNILENDSDANGDEFIIDEVYLLSSNLTIEVSEDSLGLTVTTRHPIYNVASFKYRIKEKNTEDAYYSDWATVTIDILDNPDIPTAVDDIANAIGGETIDIYVLENDINPSSSQLEIERVGEATLGSVGIVNDHLTYTPNYSAYGSETLSYGIRLADQTYLYDFGQVIINVANNPGCPVVVDDVGTGICGGETIVEVLENDYDPEGAEIEIKDVRLVYPSSLNVQIQGTSIIVTGALGDIVINSENVRLEYRVQEVNNPESYSEWATVTIEMEQDANYPMLFNDYATTISGYPTEIDILANDMLNGYDPLFFFASNYGHCQLNDKLTFTSYMTTNGFAKFTYRAMGAVDGYISFGEIEVEIEPNNSYDSLDINNINAGIHSDGFLFSSYDEVIDYDISNYKPHFEYPKGSGKHSIFSNSLWIGGIDQNDSLHLAAQRYKQDGYDYQFGPISNNYDNLEFFTKWSRLWKVNKEDISYHRNNYWKEDYEPVDAIITWPGNGDVSNGQAEQLAPYFDSNENGIYEPLSGDYPLIRGDQSVLFIFNDDRIHTETMGGSLEVEVHGMAYGFDEPENELLNNTVFVHYDIYNRSENTYYNTYFGTWTDIDLGYAQDDYVGCNVELGSYYGYNGRLVDGNGEPEAYGANPPAQSVTIVSGPFMDEDNTDNPDGGCDNSINGLNFGDGIIDNERLGMTGFVYHNNNSGALGDPNIAPQYYNYMNGFWKDNTSIMYGGTGHVTSSGTVGPECSFMFPGDSDPCNWGTDGVLPNDGYNQEGKYWTEETGDNGLPNPPEDRRGLGVTGPFTFDPGERQELELAFSVGQGEDGPYSSTEQLFENLTNLFQLVEDGQIIIPSDQLSVEEQESNKVNLKVYPNPAKEFVSVKIDGNIYEKLNYQIYNNLGKLVVSGEIFANIKNTIDIQNFELGLYIIKIQNQGVVFSGRFIKM
ncbi:MAG: Ig-like domain-containing protein [Candidatus Tenebribacter mawsonii]|nr:Ig-like domain-containing protein [Candidatus Tenebribacter mawsonii]